MMIHEERMEAAPDIQAGYDWKPPQRLTDRVQALEGEIRAEEKNAKRPDFSLNLESNLRDASLLVRGRMLHGR
jgi:hypothetical protein